MGVKSGAYGRDDKPVIGIPAGTMAVWDAGPSNDDYAPVIAPHSNLDKIRFHSDLDYLRIDEDLSKASGDPGMSAVSLPSTGVNEVLDSETLLFAHGLGYVPFISGDITISGYTQPCAGSMVPVPGGVIGNAGHRFITFTADTANVYLHAFGLIAPAMTVGWTVRVYEEEFGVVSSPAKTFRVEAGSIAGKNLGKIDAAHRYVRGDSAPGAFRVLGKQTIDLRQRGGVNGPDFHFSDGQTDGAFNTILLAASPPGDPAPAYSVTGQPAKL